MVDDVEDVAAVVEVVDVGSEEVEVLVGATTEADFTSSVSEGAVSGRANPPTTNSTNADIETRPQRRFIFVS